MRINRIDTKAYPIGEDEDNFAIQSFKDRINNLKHMAKTNVKAKAIYKYIPLCVLSAVKYDSSGKGIIIEGMENKFHVGLPDGAFYVYSSKGVKDMAIGSVVKTPAIQIERIDLLLDIATLSPTAMKTLGYLLDQGTINYEQLDMLQQQAAKELQGRKFADIYRPLDRESDLTKVFKDIFEMTPVTPIYKVKPLLPVPMFTNPKYNLSARLGLCNEVEDDVELEKIAYAPEKLMFIIQTMFNCSLIFERVVYLPYLECTYEWGDKQSTEMTYIPCPKSGKIKEFIERKMLKTVTIGTKGHALDAVCFEDVMIDFSNVAGMADVKEKIREGIIYPMLHPEASEEYGTHGGGGVLFYGPPGCGKSYIMKATVGEAGVNFFSVSVQEIIGGDMETASNKLDQAFSEARESAPSILFFDEIDALAGSRKSGQSGSERRLVNQFLINMEGVGATNENVLIVGSTNAPWDMDSALRRAGRFTTQILIPPPDFEARKSLLKLHTKGRPLAADIDFDYLADMTENYSSADMTAICDEAAKIPWRESIHGSTQRLITQKDFLTILEERESTLTPWLRVAEKQLRESGEADVFPELAEYVFKRAGGIESAQTPSIKFADVGGLEDVKEDIRAKIVYPLKHPELSEEYGRKIGGGLLLYGPPGCGKTYIAKATAGECEANFFNVKITDLMSPEEGVTEKRLHAIFERAARNSPAIIFFDEIDALAGSRTSAEGGAQRRLINQFLTEMDGFEKKEGVIVLGATNAPWDIDPALRRAGRFSEQIFLPPPDLESREQILGIHLKGRPIDESVDAKVIAKMSDGFSAADIALICDEAAKIPWKESMETGDKRKINMNDFHTVIAETNPSITPWIKQAEKQLKESGEMDVYPGLTEYVMKRAGGIDAASRPDMDFSNVGGLGSVKEDIKNKVVYPMLNPELAKEYGRTVHGGILLYGPPGCGKTYIAKATAGECKATFFNVKMTDLMSPKEGETEAKLHAIFQRAARNSPAIIFFDEIDAVAGQRSSSGGGAQRRLINQFLTEMDGFEGASGVIVLGATNAPWDIDPALRRAGRFSDQIFLPPPDAESREQIFGIHLKKYPVDDSIDRKILAELTEGYSAADIALICEEATKIPWKESMETGNKRKMNQADMEATIKVRDSSLGPWFKQAKKELVASGEKENFPTMFQYLEDRAALDGGKSALADPRVAELEQKRLEAELMIKAVKQRVAKGEMDDETARQLLMDYEKSLIEVDAKLMVLKGS